MIFSCARCETRYKLPDDKVSNRVVKVRCRRCGVIIVVRDPSRPQGATVETEAVWFAAIDGEQRGPLTAGALQQLIESAVLTASTFVWKVGMGDWLPARDVPEISALIASIGPPPMPDAAAQAAPTSVPDTGELHVAATLVDGDEAATIEERAAPAPDDDSTVELKDLEQAPLEPWVRDDEQNLAYDDTIQGFDANSGLEQVDDTPGPETVEVVSAAPEAELVTSEMEVSATEPQGVGDVSSLASEEPPRTVSESEPTPPIEDDGASLESSTLDDSPTETPEGGEVVDDALIASSADPVDSVEGTMEEGAAPDPPAENPELEELVTAELPSEAVATHQVEIHEAPSEDAGVATLSAESVETSVDPEVAPASVTEPVDEALADPAAAPEEQEEVAVEPDVAAEELSEPEPSPEPVEVTSETLEGADADGNVEAPESDVTEEAATPDLGEEDASEAVAAPLTEAEEPAEPVDDAGAEDPEYQGGLGDADPTVRMAKPDLQEPEQDAVTPSETTVQDVVAADVSEVSGEPPSSTESSVDPLAPAGADVDLDAGPATRVDPPPEPTIDTLAAGATPPEEMATQPETEAAPEPKSDDPLELAEDLFAGVKGAMNTEELKRMAAPKAVSTLDLIQAPDLENEEAQPTDEDKEFFKQAMRSGSRVQAMSITAMEAIDKSELKELREEFGVVGELEAAGRKRKLIAVVTIALVVSGVVGAISLYQSQREDLKNANRAEFAADESSVPVAEHRAVYEVGDDEAEAAAEEARLAAEEAKREAEEQSRLEAEKQARADKWESQKAYMAKKKAEKAEASRKTYNKLSASDYKKLMTDSSGKSEVKLKFSARDQADKAAKEAAAKRKKKGDARAGEVVATFGRKRRQLARCKSGEDEKVRAQFTVAPNGRVTGVKVTGTQSPKKRDCVKGILKQAIFPKGPETNTYAMPFTL